ncbi:MAG: hypothetical protein WAV07_10500 [Candidatus Contendobacter sp.]
MWVIGWVREYPDWKEHLDKIEIELTKRNELFTPIILADTSDSQLKPAPVEAVLYERIKTCLAYEDQLPSDANKPYGVRLYSDWAAQAKQFEKALDNFGYSYSRIVW